MQPKLTIIMSTYNDGRYLEQAIQSILMQTFTDWEFVLINDASTDNTDEIVTRLLGKDKRVLYVKNENRCGITSNIKRCVRLAKTEFIARLDGDDYWTDEHKLQEQYDVMQTYPKVGIVGTWATVVDANDKELYKIKYPATDKKMRSKILRENPFVSSSVMFRKPTGGMINHIIPSNKYADDYNLVLEIGIDHEYLNVPKIYTAYRKNTKGVSQSKYTEQIEDTLGIISYYKDNYTGYHLARIMWMLRRRYPRWLKGRISMQVKRIFGYY